MNEIENLKNRRAKNITLLSRLVLYQYGTMTVERRCCEIKQSAVRLRATITESRFYFYGLAKNCRSALQWRSLWSRLMRVNYMEN